MLKNLRSIEINANTHVFTATFPVPDVSPTNVDTSAGKTCLIKLISLLRYASKNRQSKYKNVKIYI